MSLVPFVIVDDDVSAVGSGDMVRVPGDQMRHIDTVLRLKHGSQVEVSDGRGNVAPGTYVGASIEMRDACVHRTLPSPSICVAQALPKGRKLDGIVKMVTEVGVDTIRLVDADRSIATMDPHRAASQMARLKAVARAASMQARRAWLPDIIAPVSVDSLIDIPGRLLVAHPSGASPSHDVTGSLLSAAIACRDEQVEALTIAIGPEGGWSPAELDMFAAQGAVVVQMGDSIIRTEHAAGAAIAVIAAGTGRW